MYGFEIVGAKSLLDNFCELSRSYSGRFSILILNSLLKGTGVGGLTRCLAVVKMVL